MGDAQVLCDRILLIDDGQRLLYGTCRRRPHGVQRRRGRGGGQEPADRRGRCSRRVSHATAYDGSVRFLLRDGQTAQDLFRELAETPAVVERFAVEAPNLAEIFVRAVAGDERAEAVA